MKTEPQDLPFWPDYMNREIGGAVKWVIAPRLTDRLRRSGHEMAIHPKRYERMQAEHAAEVRAAVTARLVAMVRTHGVPATKAATIIARLLADPALRIVTNHYDRSAAA